MRATTCFILMLSSALSGCSAPGGPYPSLQPRAAESIDPRIPINRPMNDRTVNPTLAGRLAELVAQARTGNADFETAAANAERLAGSSGAPQTEGWIAAQEALTAAIAARGPTTAALSDIDAIGATALQAQGGIAPHDLAAIRSAGAEVAAMDQREAERIKAIQQRLGQ